MDKADTASYTSYDIEYWIDCEYGSSRYDVTEYCNSYGITVNILDEEDNITGTLSANRLCYNAITNSMYEIGSTDGKKATIEVYEIGENVAVYYDDLKSVFTSSSSSNFDEATLVKKESGDSWDMEIGSS
ncbi:MAG: hypothetical protein GY696_00975, partial [Gammaproteobacteria bacterium]|nr:hypothetical protein [Gammaproteobacteria bacterium]